WVIRFVGIGLCFFLVCRQTPSTSQHIFSSNRYEQDQHLWIHVHKQDVTCGSPLLRDWLSQFDGNTLPPQHAAPQFLTLWHALRHDAMRIGTWLEQTNIKLSRHLAEADHLDDAMRQACFAHAAPTQTRHTLQALQAVQGLQTFETMQAVPALQALQTLPASSLGETKAPTVCQRPAGPNGAAAPVAATTTTTRANQQDQSVASSAEAVAEAEEDDMWNDDTHDTIYRSFPKLCMDSFMPRCDLCTTAPHGARRWLCQFIHDGACLCSDNLHDANNDNDKQARALSVTVERPPLPRVLVQHVLVWMSAVVQEVAVFHQQLVNDLQPMVDLDERLRRFCLNAVTMLVQECCLIFMNKTSLIRPDGTPTPEYDVLSPSPPPLQLDDKE
ncbi:MAG: hypothetical protein ACXVOI_04475, partial [Tumebacillaceae bacterium]